MFFGVFNYKWEMLTGRVPFDGGHPTATMLKHLTDRPKPPSEIAQNQRIPPELDQLVLRTMAKEPKERFASMAELEEALATQFSQLKQRSPSTAGLQLVRLAPPPTSLGRLTAVLSLGAVVLFGGGLSLRWLIQRRAATMPPKLESRQPTHVHWRVETQPSGAEVWNVTDGHKIGVTPWQQDEPLGEGALVIELRKSGFVAKQLTLSKKSDEDRTEPLAPRKEKDRGSGTKKSGKKRKTRDNSQVELIPD